MLADFHPKGAVAASYGAYLDGAGITDRATVLIDSSGSVRYASSVTPAGQRDISELVKTCERLDLESETPTQPMSDPKELGSDAVLYVKSRCGFSRRVRVAIDNLHAHDLDVRNASDSADALAELRQASGTETAPCLILDGQPVSESDVIVRVLAERLAPVR